MSTSAKGKMKKYTAEEVLSRRKAKTKTEETPDTKTLASVEEFANIEENEFYKILFDPNLSPREKKAAYEKELAYDETKTKAENVAKYEANEQLKDWLNTRRKEVTKDLIRLSDTEAFAEMQTVLEEMNDAMLGFEDLIGPLVDTIDAIHTLNMESDGQMYEVFKEIKEDAAEEARIAEQKAEMERQVQAMEEEASKLRAENTVHKDDKSWFGLGSIKKSAQVTIAQNNEKLARIADDAARLTREKNGLKSDRETKFAHLSAEKAELRKLLDLTSSENIERQEQLVESALNFVNTTDEKTKSVLNHMRDIKEQIDTVDNTNGKMRRAFAVIKEAEMGATDNSIELSKEFEKAIDGLEHPDSLEAMEKKTIRDNVNEHVQILADASKVTLKTSAKLEEEGMTIKSLADNNRQQISTTKEMNTEGTASVAGRLLSTLTAFSSAALNEAKTTTVNTMKVMDKTTRGIMQREVIMSAANKHTENDELAQLIDKMEETKAVGMEEIQIARSAIETRRKLKTDMERITQQLAEVVEESKGLEAEAGNLESDAGPIRSGRAATEQDNSKPKTPAPGLNTLNI